MSGEPKPGPRYKVQLRIDGQPVPLKAFIHDLLGGAVVGMLEGLKDCQDLETIELRIDKRQLGSGRDDETDD